ncbi:fumarylacetoacetate hydrolase family protein [Pantoea phytobeneficialis]|uniref:5-carboxymethyl-2-hydroxymuconate isomerase n=1 Tax=Pantoea phytobeneficialis TaxID=2052056 RepID=A0AAP9KP74_9GAMM|nr:fumarylacetoacetate hydrolase family protein [Pantoea phytobeneficialis]MDO6405689.1 fumarylacetoacetate hydrolase family protein [Pantoea phytobeneficialis]QGR06671.1 5-carboxymethyl-2-hydroxymuconate isomerase [Pantoea phytobeneficialis]
MKLVRFTEQGRTRIGKVVDDQVIDLSGVPGVTGSMRQLLTSLATLRPRLEAVHSPAYALATVQLEAPIQDAQKFLGIGMNYRKHAEEARQAGIPIPESQLWFNKQVSCINGPFSPVVKPAASEKMDYEIELGVVIGKRCRHVSASDAASVIAGYLIVNDVSARDWLHKSPTFTLGKSFDTHGPIGPWITTADEIPDPLRLEMKLFVNGELRQHADSGDMIYDIYAQIAYLSTVMTLEPGDILATGTPSGIGAPTGRFLQPGDVMRLEIEGLGHIENPVVEERI